MKNVGVCELWLFSVGSRCAVRGVCHPPVPVPKPSVPRENLGGGRIMPGAAPSSPLFDVTGQKSLHLPSQNPNP